MDHGHPPTSLCLFEPKWRGGGHHPSWFKEVVAQWLTLGYRVTAFCPSPEEVTASLSGRLPREDLARLSLHRVPDQRDLLGKWSRSPFRMFRVVWMASVYNRILCSVLGKSPTGATYVFFGLTDLFALRLLGFGRLASSRFTHPFVGLYFFPSPSPPKFPAGVLFDDLGFFRGTSCKSVLILNENLRVPLAKRLGKPVHVLPDFVAHGTESPYGSKEGDLATLVKAKAAGRRIVLLAGDISPRKGVGKFLELAASAVEENWFFVIAGFIHRGAFAETERRALDSSAAHSNLLVHPHRIETDEAFGALVSCSDVLYAVYPSFPHSSNLLIQAATHRVPVLVADGFLMAERVRRFGLGGVTPYGDTAATHRVLRTLLEPDPAWKARFQTGCERYRSLHSAETFARDAARICFGERASPADGP